MAWVNILDVPELIVSVDGGFSIGGGVISFDSGVVLGDGTNRGHVYVNAPVDLPSGMIVATRYTEIIVTSLATLPAAISSIFGGYFIVNIQPGMGGWDYELPVPGCYDAVNNVTPTYGYKLEAASSTWIGPGWGPDSTTVNPGCADSPVFINELDLSVYVNGGATAVAAGLVMFANNNNTYINARAIGTILIEVDYTPPPPADFWTDFVNASEVDTSDLSKDTMYAFYPPIEARPYLPPSFDCYPAPPDGPPVDPPGGGNGSGPPHGECYYADVYQQFFLCCGYPPDDPRACFTCTLTTLLVGRIQICP